MRFFVVSERGDGAGVAARLVREGHEVLMYFRDITARKNLDGIVKKVFSIQEGLNELPDVVVFDMVGFGNEAEKVREAGFRVFGGGKWNDKLELDRKFSMKTMDVMGIKAPKSFAFSNFKDAMGFVKSYRKLLVLKPFNNMNTEFTYVPKNQDDLLNYMGYLVKKLGVNGKVLLQDFVQGTEISTEVWYARGIPVPMPNSTIECKKLMNGDIGSNTGSQISIVWGYPTREPRIVQQGLKKLNAFMKKIEYTGPIDLNGIVRNKKLYGLEFTPRMGYSALYALIRILKEPLGKLLFRVASGDASEMALADGFGMACKVSIPPFPYWPEDKAMRKQVWEKTAGQRVGGLSKEDWDRVFPLDVYKKDDEFFTAGHDGAVLECTGYGKSIYEAEDEVMGLFKKIALPNKQIRTDGARVAEKRIWDLRDQGYEVPPFEMPKPMAIMEDVAVVSTKKEEKKDEPKKDSRIGIAAKLNVRPGAIASDINRGKV